MGAFHAPNRGRETANAKASAILRRARVDCFSAREPLIGEQAEAGNIVIALPVKVLVPKNTLLLEP